VDTWHILEQRFHEIGNRDHCLAMTFEKEDDEKYWYYLEGGLGQQYLGDGRWAGVLIGAPHPDAPVSPKKSKGTTTLIRICSSLFNALDGF